MKLVLNPKPKTFFIEECPHLSVVELVVPEVIPSLLKDIYTRMRNQKYLVDRQNNKLINLSIPGSVFIDYRDVYSSSFTFHKFEAEIHITPVL